MPAKKTNKKKPYIAHRRHSFKLLPTHHTSYSLSLFMLLFVGIFSLSFTTFVSGATTHEDSYAVNAVVPADPLTTAATFDSPADQVRFKEQTITASGTCPAESYVKLLRNNIFAGSAICDSSGEWSIELTLVAGKNELQVQAYNRTDQAGPTTPLRTVYYDAPKPVIIDDTPGATPDATPPTTTTQPTTNSSSQPQAPTAPPLILSGDFSFKGVTVGNELTQTFTLAGGSAPYAISIDWGDGSTDLISRSNDGEFIVKHVYTNTGNNDNNTYVITIDASDGNGQRARLQTMAIVTAPGANGASSGLTQFGIGDDVDNGANTLFETFWKVTAPTITVSAVALGSFWLGQRRELEVLRHSARHYHKHRPV